MADDTWPSSLRQALIEPGFRRRRKKTKVTSNPETGPTRERRRSTVSVFLIRGNVLMDLTEIPTFENFYTNTLGEGVKRFNWVDPLDRATAVEMKFVEPDYQIDPAGGTTFRVSMSLEMYK